MRAVLIFLLMFCGVAQAQEEPRAMLRTRLENPGPFLVGEPIRLRVDVLTTTWLTRAPVFPTFEIEGALVVLPDERSSNLSERIDGQTWFGVSRSYLIYAQEPRAYEVPPVAMAVFYGQAEKPAALRFQPQSFRARIPDEARGLGYFIATRELRVTQELDRGLEGLKVGDSVQRTILMSADRTFSMFLPPVEFEEMEGLAVYPDPPKVRDLSEDRIGFQGGERIESATYVIREPGGFELAPVVVYWWDLDAGRMREAGVPAVGFTAAPNPEAGQEIAIPEPEPVQEIVPEEKHWRDLARQWAGPLAVVLLVVVPAVSFAPRMIKAARRRIAQRRMAYTESAAAAFDRARKAAREGDSENLVRNLYRWIDGVAPEGRIGTLEYFSGKDRRLDEQVAAICANRYSGKPERRWSRTDFIRRLARLRREMDRIEGPSKRGESRLPDLNPPPR